MIDDHGKIQWFKFATDGPAHGIPSSLAFLFPLYVLLSDFELMASARIKVDVWILFAYVDEPKHLTAVCESNDTGGNERRRKKEVEGLRPDDARRTSFPFLSARQLSWRREALPDSDLFSFSLSPPRSLPGVISFANRCKNVMCRQPLVGEDRYLKLPTGPDACGYSQPTSVLAQDACPATPR
jgi:hypothetical protein